MTIIVDLADLGNQGFVIQGRAYRDYTGGSVSSAGDLNSDGYADVIVGASGGDDGLRNAGNAYVIFGKEDGFGAIDLAALSSADGYVIQGAHGHDDAGYGVSGGGDFNGDGYADILVGASRNKDGGANAGDAYVIFGQANGFGRIDLAHLDPADGLTIQGDTKNDRLGLSLSLAGDVNNDGFADAVVSAIFKRTNAGETGAVYVIFGNADGLGRLDLSHLKPADGFTIFGEGSGDYTGVSVTSAGDVNGDGYADLIFAGGNGDRGDGTVNEAYVILGKAGGFADIDLHTLAPADGFRIVADYGAFDDLTATASAGDFNADGFDDIILGTPYIGSAGTAYMLFGKADGFGTPNLSHFEPSDGFVISGVSSGEYFASSASSAGDVNGDGLDDVIVGAARNGDAGQYAGKAYVIYGRAEGFADIDLTDLREADGFAIQGEDTYDFAGSSVSAAGDVNGDGFADVIVGAYRAAGSGAAYVIFGMAPTEAVHRLGTEIAQTIRGGVGDDVLDGRGGDDTLISADGDDKLLGGTGDDDLDGGDGKDKLEGGNGDDLLHGGVGADRLSGGRGADVLYGGADKDTLTGGAGADSFHFSLGGTASDAAGADAITDFSHAERDVIDLTDYDADASTKGTVDPFTFVGAAAFSGSVGELRYEIAGGDTLVSGDTNGDKAADFTIRLTSDVALTAADFMFAAPASQAHGFLAHPDVAGNHLLQLA